VEAFVGVDAVGLGDRESFGWVGCYSGAAVVAGTMSDCLYAPQLLACAS
jgi:hypothetical protein